MDKILKIGIHTRLHFMIVSKRGLIQCSLCCWDKLGNLLPPFPKYIYREKLIYLSIYLYLLIYSLYPKLVLYESSIWAKKSHKTSQSMNKCFQNEKSCPARHKVTEGIKKIFDKFDYINI